MYSNGFNPNIPASTPATVNFAGEIRAICKPQLAHTIDPNTGIYYLAEGQHIIEGTGLLPRSRLA